MLLYNNYLFFIKNYISFIVPKFVINVNVFKNSITIYTYSIFIRELSLFLRDSNKMLYKVLVELVCSDFIYRELRFELTYMFLSFYYCFRINVKYNVDIFDKVYSLNSIYMNHSWYEREVWDLFGIYFIYHNDLRRILTDYGFKGFPFRKDFPLSGYYDFCFDYLNNRVSTRAICFYNEFRLFNYNLGWFQGRLLKKKSEFSMSIFLYLRLVFLQILNIFLC